MERSILSKSDQQTKSQCCSNIYKRLPGKTNQKRERKSFHSDQENHQQRWYYNSKHICINFRASNCIRKNPHQFGIKSQNMPTHSSQSLQHPAYTDGLIIQKKLNMGTLKLNNLRDEICLTEVCIIFLSNSAKYTFPGCFSETDQIVVYNANLN